MKKLISFVLVIATLFSFSIILTSCKNEDSISCLYCGIKNPNTAIYCSNCGEKLSNNNEDEEGSVGLEYHLKSDDTYSVSWGTTNLLDKLCIPKTYNGKPVTAIEPRGWITPWNAKEIIIPDSITTISRNAFRSFVYLTDFIVPNHITAIEEGAFSGCVNLKTITLPNTIKTIEAETFNFCISLEQIVLPNSIEEIKRSAFDDCYQLTSITIPDSVVDIDHTAFYGCSRLVEIINYSNFDFNNYYINNNIRIFHQGESLIKNVDGFKFITIDNVNYLISYVGKDEKIVLPEYYGNSKYELLPYCSLAYLTNYGYPSLINVKEIVIPDTINSIPAATFQSSRALTKVTLPKTISSIGGQIGRDTSISDIYYLGTENEWNNITFENDWKYDIGNATVHCIGNAS